MSQGSPEGAGKPCARCRTGVDKHGHEWIQLCADHLSEAAARHIAAIESASHVYRAQLVAEELTRARA